MNRPGQSLLSRLNFSRPEERPSKQYRFSAEALLKLLSQLRSGHLQIILPNNERKEFGNPADALHAEIGDKYGAPLEFMMN
jgi:cyclopropane-fatty-acyl-phospholipid synthase